MLGRISLAQSPGERRGIFGCQRDGPSCAICPSVMNDTMDLGIRPVDHGQLSSHSPEPFPSQASKSSREDRTSSRRPAYLPSSIYCTPFAQQGAMAPRQVEREH
jgi:hypothetical protein